VSPRMRKKMSCGEVVGGGDVGGLGAVVVGVGSWRSVVEVCSVVLVDGYGSLWIVVLVYGYGSCCVVVEVDGVVDVVEPVSCGRVVVDPSWWPVGEVDGGVLVFDEGAWPGSLAVPYWEPPRASTSLSTPW